MKITTVAEIPEGMAHKWLQHLRDFDTAHPGCIFRIVIADDDSTTDDILKVLDVDPPLPHVTILKPSQG